MTTPTDVEPRWIDWRTPRAERAEAAFGVALIMAIATAASIAAFTFGATIPGIGCALIALAPGAHRVATHLRTAKQRRQQLATENIDDMT